MHSLSIVEVSNDAYPNAYRVPQSQCDNDQVDQSQNRAIAFVLYWGVVGAEPNLRDLQGLCMCRRECIIL